MNAAKKRSQTALFMVALIISATELPITPVSNASMPAGEKIKHTSIHALALYHTFLGTTRTRTMAAPTTTLAKSSGITFNRGETLFILRCGQLPCI